MTNQEAFAFILSQRADISNLSHQGPVGIAQDPDAIEASRRMQNNNSRNRLEVISGDNSL